MGIDIGRNRRSLIACCSLPCMQGRAGVGLHELAAKLKSIARLFHPTLALPYYT